MSVAIGPKIPDNSNCTEQPPSKKLKNLILIAALKGFGENLRKLNQLVNQLPGEEFAARISALREQRECDRELYGPSVDEEECYKILKHVDRMVEISKQGRQAIENLLIITQTFVRPG